jgi:segregation and condensation protein B
VAGRPVRLTRAQLETLAIVAYRQPITKPEIDEIRGVDAGGTLHLLLDRQLVRVLGKKEEPGRPLLYGTTKDFLEFFNLSDLRDLPTLREYHELSEDSRRLVEEKLGADAAAEAATETGEAGDVAEVADAPESEPTAPA